MLKESVDKEVDRVVETIVGVDEEALMTRESSDEKDAAYVATGSAGITFKVEHVFQAEVVKFIRQMLG